MAQLIRGLMNMARSNIAFYALTLALTVTLVSSTSHSSSTDAPIAYEMLIFPVGCFNKFLAGDVFDSFCLKKTVSKVLGYGIITGACIVKLPQILRFITSGSVVGISKWSTYLELLGYLLSSIYHILQGNPWSAYGETVIVMLQAAIITIMVWIYDPPGFLHMAMVTAVLAAAAQWTLTAPREYLPSVQITTIVLFVLSRAWQIVANAQNKSTGELSPLTLFMNAAGSAARIFTSSQEVKQVEVLISFVISTALNVTLLWQYFYYTFFSNNKSKAKKEPTKDTSNSSGPEAAPRSSGKSSAVRQRPKRSE